MGMAMPGMVKQQASPKATKVRRQVGAHNLASQDACFFLTSALRGAQGERRGSNALHGAFLGS